MLRRSVIIIGSSSGWLGVVIASLVGAITLIPGFIAFPTAAMKHVKRYSLFICMIALTGIIVGIFVIAFVVDKLMSRKAVEELYIKASSSD